MPAGHDPGAGAGDDHPALRRRAPRRARGPAAYSGSSGSVRAEPKIVTFGTSRYGANVAERGSHLLERGVGDLQVEPVGAVAGQAHRGGEDLEQLVAVAVTPVASSRSAIARRARRCRSGTGESGRTSRAVSLDVACSPMAVTCVGAARSPMATPTSARRQSTSTRHGVTAAVRARARALDRGQARRSVVVTVSRRARPGRRAWCAARGVRPSGSTSARKSASSMPWPWLAPAARRDVLVHQRAAEVVDARPAAAGATPSRPSFTHDAWMLSMQPW